MADLSLPARDAVAAQQKLFAEAERLHSLSITVLAQRNRHLKPSTMRSWREGAQMPAWAIGELSTAGVPDELLSLVTAPFGMCIVSEPEGDGDLDTAAGDALDFAQAVGAARHPSSPGGLVIVPQERAIIEPKRRRMVASGRRAVA